MKQNFFDQLDGNWMDVISNVYAEADNTDVIIEPINNNLFLFNKNNYFYLDFNEKNTNNTKLAYLEFKDKVVLTNHTELDIRVNKLYKSNKAIYVANIKILYEMNDIICDGKRLVEIFPEVNSKYVNTYVHFILTFDSITKEPEEPEKIKIIKNTFKERFIKKLNTELIKSSSNKLKLL